MIEVGWKWRWRGGSLRADSSIGPTAPLGGPRRQRWGLLGHRDGALPVWMSKIICGTLP